MRGVLLALLRIAVGLALAAAGLLALRDREATADDLARFGLPAPETLSLVVVGALVVAGLAVATGLATRSGALVLGLLMLATVATAGRIDRGAWLAAPIVLALLCLVLVARGGGRGQLLDRIDPPA